MFWNHQNVKGILIDLMQGVLSKHPYLSKNSIIDGNDLAEDYGLSSMQLVELATLVNSFFHFFDVEYPPNLLTDSFIDHWVAKIMTVRSERDEFVSFKSSGTTGVSKLITHRIDSINNEVDFLKHLLKPPKRIISFVPANHIYGFLFTVVLPHIWGIPMIKMNELNTFNFESNDLIIATPFNWQFIHNSINTTKMNCTGVSSGAPLNNQLYNQLLNSGFCITEIYGSTETAGVGFRKLPFSAFELFPYWRFDANAEHIIRLNDQQIFKLLDQIELQNVSSFYVKSRLDHVVQIGGVNISLIEIEKKIRAIQLVKEVSIYAKASGTSILIGATIFLYHEDEDTKKTFMKTLHKVLDPLEIPTIISFVH